MSQQQPSQKQERSMLGLFGVNCSQARKDQKQLQIDIKCMINQDVLVLKMDKQTQQMLDVKIEFCIYVERRYLECIEGFKTNYDRANDVVQLVVLCSQGIKIPRDQDFFVFLENFDRFCKGKQVLKQEIQNKPLKYIYRQLICAIVLQEERLMDFYINFISETLNMYKLMQLSLITTQYEANQYASYFYSLFIQYFQYVGGVYAQQITNLHLQQILLHISTSTVQILQEDIIIVNDGDRKLQIGTIFYKSLHRAVINKKKKFFQPLQKYQYYKNQRRKNHNVGEDTYPHYFRLLDEAESKVHLVAYQQSAHSEILIFEKEQPQYIKYSDDYIGSIERNFWGTVFQVYDYGYPPETAQFFPKYFGHERKEMANIQYQTNIMASVPRKFSSVMLNYVNNQHMKLSQLEPVYNEEKECYQLNFYGRAKRASARNFEIIDPEDPNTIYLLHGKWEKNLFNLDYRYPMNMAQAFSFSLVSISKKFLVQ